MVNICKHLFLLCVIILEVLANQQNAGKFFVSNVDPADNVPNDPVILNKLVAMKIMSDNNDNAILDSNLTVFKQTYMKDLVTVIDPLKNSLENLLTSVENLVSSLLETLSLLLEKLDPILGRLLAFIIDMLNELLSRILTYLKIGLGSLLNYLSFLLNYMSEQLDKLTEKLSRILITFNKLTQELESTDSKCANDLRSLMIDEISQLQNSLQLCNTDLSNSLHTSFHPLTSRVSTITGMLSSVDLSLKECLPKNRITLLACATKVLSKTFVTSLSLLLNDIENIMPDISRNLGDVTVNMTDCMEDAFLHTTKNALAITDQAAECTNKTISKI